MGTGEMFGGVERKGEGKQRGTSGAAELSSSELQHWVLRPCWTTARTTQQQTQRINSLCCSLALGFSVLLPVSSSLNLSASQWIIVVEEMDERERSQ